jgi:nucleoside-diphosphate-sugar epimerase
VYGPRILGPGPVSEDRTPPEPDTLYGITKYAGERAALRLGQCWGIDARAARIGSVFGPWEGETGARDTLSVYAQVAAAAARGVPAVLPGPYPHREMIYAPDLAAGLIALMTADEPAHACYNLSANLDWDQGLRHWCEALAARIPGFQWRYAEPGETPGIHYHGALPRVSMDAARARADLGWAPRHPRAAALADYAAWVAGHQAYFA